MAVWIRRIFVPVMVAELAVALAFTANELVRPGCSLLPVTLPDDEEHSTPGTLAEACVVLGRPVPSPTVVPAGMTRAEIGIDGPPPLGLPCCRKVRVSYALKGKNVALMDVHRQEAIPPGNLRDVNATLGGVPAVIQQSYNASAGADDVWYLWARDGLLIGLHVLLADGITRQTADDFAASIR
jgi:hypothetical protein